MSGYNLVEQYILEKYGELVGIYEDTVIHNPGFEQVIAARNKPDHYSIRTFSTGYIIYLKNSFDNNDFDNGVPRIWPFDQGIKYGGDIHAIQQIRYLPISPKEEFSCGFITIFERKKVAIYRITCDPDKNGIEKLVVFPRPEDLLDSDIPKIQSFTWSRNDIIFNFG